MKPLVRLNILAVTKSKKVLNGDVENNIQINLKDPTGQIWDD